MQLPAESNPSLLTTWMRCDGSRHLAGSVNPAAVPSAAGAGAGIGSTGLLPANRIPRWMYYSTDGHRGCDWVCAFHPLRSSPQNNSYYNASSSYASQHLLPSTAVPYSLYYLLGSPFRRAGKSPRARLTDGPAALAVLPACSRWWRMICVPRFPFASFPSVLRPSSRCTDRHLSG